MKNKVLIWLDDCRSPFADDGKWLVFSPLEQPYEVVWVKTYKEFTDWITTNGLPDGICFDNDLSDFQALYYGYPQQFEDVLWPENEKTGYDCAKMVN